MKEKIWSKSFISVFICNLFIFIVFYGLLTTLPIYAIDNLHRSDADAGLIVTVFLISAILVRPFSGKVLEMFGKKKILIISTIFFLLTTLLYTWTDQFYFLLLLRFFHGIWFSLITTATGSIAADVIPPKRRGEGLGYFAMSMNIAVVIGPFIALTLLQFITFQLLFVVLTFIAVGGILFTFLIKVSEAQSHQQSEKLKRKLSWDDLIERKALLFALIGSLIAFSYSSVISFISIYTKHLNLLEYASYFFIAFAVAMLISRPFAGRLFDTKGPTVVIVPSFLLFFTGLFTLSLVNSPVVLLLAGVFIGLGYGTLVPCLQTLAVQSCERERSSHAIATFFTLFDTGIATGSYLLGTVATNFGYSHLYLYISIFVLLTLYIFIKFVSSKGKTYQVGAHVESH